MKWWYEWYNKVNISCLKNEFLIKFEEVQKEGLSVTIRACRADQRSPKAAPCLRMFRRNVAGSYQSRWLETFWWLPNLIEKTSVDLKRSAGVFYFVAVCVNIIIDPPNPTDKVQITEHNNYKW